MESIEPGRLGTRIQRLDPGLALAVLCVAVTYVIDRSSHSHLAGGRLGLHSTTSPWLVAVLAVTLALVGVALRDRSPLAAPCLVATALVATPTLTVVLGPAFVVLYSVGAVRGRRDAGIGLFAMVVALVLQRAIWGPAAHDSLPLALIGSVATAAFALYVGAGRAIDGERTAFERRQEVLVAERTVAEERVRIARELHDVVAHTMSLIIVQAEVLRTKLDDEQRRGAAAEIAGLGRDAMAELHRTLDLLRGADETAERAPGAVLADLPQLTDQSRGSGLAVALSVEGEPRSLPASLELTAYRIVQEALTNVRRHAAAKHAAVRVRYGLDALEVSIEDDGVAGASGVGSDGHGVRGMRERAAMLGGAVSVGPLEHGGYRVNAILPYPQPR
jgi:signal transduction histidine kinase